MLRLLSFSLALFLLTPLYASQEQLVLLGKVNFQEERMSTVIEQRFVVKILEKYIGPNYILPLIDLRMFIDINQQPVTFSPEDKVLFITEKQKDNTHKVIEYIKYPVNYQFSVNLDKTYKFIFTEKLEKTIQSQLDKHKSFVDGSFEFLHYENQAGHQLEFYNISMPVYSYSAFRSYLEKELVEFSNYYTFEKKQQYKVIINNGRASVNLQRYRTRIEQFPAL